jgi:hypothetical protein
MEPIRPIGPRHDAEPITRVVPLTPREREEQRRRREERRRERERSEKPRDGGDPPRLDVRV